MTLGAGSRNRKNRGGRSRCCCSPCRSPTVPDPTSATCQQGRESLDGRVALCQAGWFAFAPALPQATIGRLLGQLTGVDLDPQQQPPPSWHRGAAPARAGQGPDPPGNGDLLSALPERVLMVIPLTTR